MRTAVAGLVAAAVLAAILADAHLFGIAFWKIVLGLAGLALFVAAGRSK